MNALAPTLPNLTIPRSIAALLLVGCLFGTVALLLWPLLLVPLQDLCAATSVVAETRCATAPNKLFGYVAMIAAFPAVLVLERLWPAVPSQRRFSVGLLVDFVWFCFSPVILVAFLIPIEDTLRWVYASYLGLGKLSLVGSLPLAAQIAIVIVLSDFVAWVAHLMRHKLWFVWEFHKIHHAQEELNYFSTARIHPFDALAILLVRFLPFAMLDANVAVPTFAVWASFVRVYEMYTHSSVRTNMGLLKYVFVTPQSHRVHHSDRPEHQDKNFANVFSVWDHVFGTQCRDYDTYPGTGVEDKAVPHPTEPTVLGAVAVYFRMLLYPFTSLRRR